MTVQDYLDLPYYIVIRHLNDETGAYYFAAVQELDGCMIHGDTDSQTFENIREAMAGWIAPKLANGFPLLPSSKSLSWEPLNSIVIPNLAAPA